MGKKCHICKKKCAGDILRADSDKYFHPHCFSCKVCSQSLSDTGFYVTPDGAFVCPKHINYNLSQPLVIDTDRSKLAAQSASSLHSPTNCAACGDHLQSGQALIALGQSWHVWCFKCAECAAVLQGEYMVCDGKPFCIRDYNLLNGVKCCECEKYIAGRVLEAGGYKFHPTCARCSRCGDIFLDGQEMYMQGNEIWHPKCEHYSVTENIAKSKKEKKKQAPTKFKSQFGQHLTYMYMLPETEQTYLRQPISPHPPQPTQFHTPHGPVIKIRKSRYSMLKTGMQRLTEDLDRTRPRSKSPHMDNEEPIELAHYPGAHVPDLDEIPPIERQDFPAPPYPYAVEEIKRRLSSSSVENDEEDELELQAAIGVTDPTKVHKQVRMLDQIDKDSSIAHVLKQNLIEESERKQKVEHLMLHWDPRNASRTASGKKMPHLRFRYDTPINASPSRHLNRPKPWVFWKDGTTDRSATTQLPCFHLPQSRTGTERAITLPDGYGYYGGTLNSHLSDHSLNETALSEYTPGPSVALRSSLPDMSKSVKTYPLEKILATNKDLPDGVDRQHLERHLNREEFEEHFGMAPIEFYKLPEWKRINMKRKLKLF